MNTVLTNTVPTELLWLSATSLMTALLWVPYIINRMVELRPWPALKNPQPDTEPEAQWALRAMRAHTNAVENLVVFAPLVLAVVVTGASTTATVTACAVYFFARAVHFLVYTAGVPVVRTLAFVTGAGAQVTLALVVLGHGLH